MRECFTMGMHAILFCHCLSTVSRLISFSGVIDSCPMLLGGQNLMRQMVFIEYPGGNISGCWQHLYMIKSQQLLNSQHLFFSVILCVTTV